MSTSAGPNKKPRSAALIIDQGKMLLIHRIKGSREYWVLPGGSIEPGESEIAACLREAKEETGLNVRVLRLFDRIENMGRTETYFRVAPTGGTLQLGEPERSRQSGSNQYILEWVGEDEFSKLNFQPEKMKARVAEELRAEDG